MSIISITFWFVLILFLNIYLLLQRTPAVWRQIYVILFSLGFAYLANGPVSLLLPATALVSWLLTRQIQRMEDGKPRRLLATVTVIAELLPLLVFKYTDFTLSTINHLLSTNFPLVEMLLPVGISFYTFQAISYTVDTYKRKLKIEPTLMEYAFYLTFFPLLFAGPITRATHLLPQLRRPFRPSSMCVYTGLWLIVCGLLKKAVIADYISQYNNWIFDDPSGYSGFECLMGIIGYTLQIYLDFSGYSDLSIGLAALLGFHLCDNFQLPYQSSNLSTFWRRWHMSLSFWFRDYLYIPLGGNRKGKFRTYLNNFITMLVAGLWHGASWMFVIWGALHGIGLIIHKAVQKTPLALKDDRGWGRVAGTLVTFIYVAIAWVFFRSDSVETAVNVLVQAFTQVDFAYLVPFVAARPVWTAMVVVAYLWVFSVRGRYVHHLHVWFVRAPWIVKLLLFVIVVQLVIHFSQDSVRPFIYAQF